MPPTAPRGHFTHIMKAGGTSFCRQVRANHPDADVYPPVAHQAAAKLFAWSLQAVDPAERQRLRWFLPHLPACTAELCGPDVVTTVVLRDPVARSVSHLRQVATRLAGDGRGDDPDELARTMRALLDVDAYREWFLEDHQARVLALSLDELPRWDANAANHFAITARWAGRRPWRRAAAPIGPQRLDAARRRLDAMDVVGVLDHLDRFVGTVAERFGWPSTAAPHANQATSDVAPDDVVERLAEANGADELVVAHARALAAG